MKIAVKKSVAISLILAIIFSFTACSSRTAMTEENITKTVETVETALKEFDTQTLEKYVSSSTLEYIIKFASNHEQFVELGKAIFADLEMEVKSVDVENQTVTVAVKNKNLSAGAKLFAQKLKNDYSSFQLLGLLDDESFLDSSLGELVGYIQKSILSSEAEITLKVEKGKKNLVLGFDEDSEDAVSGGALSSIKSIFGK